MDDLKFKNFEFIPCILHSQMKLEVYKILEKLIYGELGLKITESYKNILENKGPDSLIYEISRSIGEEPKENLKLKRTNIKDMLENYVIRNKKGQDFLKALNLKILLKIIPNKNLIVKNGDIVDIIS
jgi:hypothetical protein